MSTGRVTILSYRSEGAAGTGSVMFRFTAMVIANTWRSETL
jgi:hypothetical protein